MATARQAVVADAAELVRLRAVMLESLEALRESAPGAPDWRAAAAEILAKELADPNGSMTAFVVDRSDAPGTLAACAVGVVEHLLPSPHNPSGVRGYVFSVATEADQRRRGYSRACMVALLDWFRDQGVLLVDLNASEYGEPLYTALGFVRQDDPGMRLRLG